MFNNLIESKAKKQGGGRYTAVSTMLVASLIASAAYATQQVHQMNEKTKQEDVKFVDVKKEEPPPPKEEPPPPPPDQPVVNPPPKGFQTLVAPIKIPDVIPDIDLSKKATDEADFSGKGVQGGVAKGVVGGSGPVNDNQAFFEFQVDKPAQQVQGVGQQPRYPESLRAAQIAGEVQAEFIVDTTGRAEMRSFKVLKATNDQFAASVKSALPTYRYLPAEAGGRKVRMVVQQAFQFNLQ
jgi:periplasmic protein TonB